MEYYWKLIQHDGTETDIPPSGVEVVKKRMANQEAIHTRTAIIPFNQIKSFRITEKVFNPQPMLEAVAGAFNEPMLNEEGEIKARWVKKHVPQASYRRFYENVAPYKFLGENNGMVIVAFKLPVHQIDPKTVEYCTVDDMKRLTTRK